MECERFRQLLSAYVDETVAEQDRQEWRQHLRACGRCRHWAVARDPSLLFATVRPEPTDLAKVESCVAAVTTLQRHDRLSRRLPRRTPLSFVAAAAVVLAMLGAGIWYVRVPNDPTQIVPGMVATQHSSEDSPPPVAPEAEVVMDQDNVRVYHLADDQDNVAVAFIVNPALEL